MKKFRHKSNGSTMTYKDGCMRIENLVIEGTPNLEFWEEVVEKDYEILLYESNPFRGVFNIECPTIKSVKRLPDGEIFNVGDYTNFGVIGGFKIFNGKIIVTYYRKGDWQWLSSISKSKKPLFKTEDGVDIFEGQNCFVVSTETIGRGIACYRIDNKSVFYLPDRNKYFSTKEKAVEFILFRKPLLSLSDVFNIYPQFKKAEPTVNTNHAEKLIELVKTKINRVTEN